MVAIKKGDGLYIVNVSEVEASAVMQHALKIHANFPPNQPTFIYLMTEFIMKKQYLYMPLEFCKLYMANARKMETLKSGRIRSKIVEDITFEDERGKECHTEYQCSYNYNRLNVECILNAERLIIGDAIIFQLVQPIQFKVYIVRQNDLVKPDRTVLRNPDVVAAEEANSGILSFEEEYLFLDSFVDIKNFQIVFNGLCIDSKLSQDCKVKYYELCCSRRSYLHSNLSNCISPTLASEIIVETTNIAEKIRGIKVCPTQESFAMLDKALNAFALLGMDVAFLRDRLIQIQNLAFDPKKIEESKKLMELKVEQDCVAKEITVLQKKLEDLKNEIEGLEMKDERDQLLLIQQASAPW